MQIIHKSIEVDIGSIETWQDNPRAIKDEDLLRLKNQIKDLGQYKPLLCVKEGGRYITLGGNMRLRAMQEMGFKKIWISEIECKDETEKIKISLSDNDRVGYYMCDELAFQIKDIDIVLQDYKVDLRVPEVNLQDIMDRNIESNEKDDEVPEVVETSIKYGDIFSLGNHRLLCGDCSLRANVERLFGDSRADMCFTDPPYGVAIGAKNRMLGTFGHSSRNYKDIANDIITKNELCAILVKSFTNLREFSQSHCSYYVTSPQGGELGMMIMMMMLSGLEVKHVLNWVKSAPTFSLGRLDYDYKHEPILYTWNEKHIFYGNGKHKYSIWEIPKPRENKLHPTMKPVELIENAILNSSKAGDIIADLFLGSGSTLIACEKTGRIGYGMELDPVYCQTIITRWEDYSKQKAVKL